VLNNLGYVALGQGDLPRAEAYFHRAFEASPGYYARAVENLQRLEAARRGPSSPARSGARP
jgi:Tfp pilus assembly protein PilF